MRIECEVEYRLTTFPLRRECTTTMLQRLCYTIVFCFVARHKYLKEYSNPLFTALFLKKSVPVGGLVVKRAYTL